MSNNEDQITASKNDSLLSEINNDSIEPELVAERPKEGVLNVFSKPENRWVIIAGAIVGIIVFGGLFIVASQMMAPKNVNVQRQGAADGTEIQQPVGNIPLPLQEEIVKKNDDIHKDNQFRHDLALEEGSKHQDQSDLLIDGFDSSEIDEFKNGCKLDDTACFRIKKMIAPDECAPKDVVCKEAISVKNGIQTQGPQNSSEIAEQKRISSPEYIKTMQDAFKEFAERKPVEIHWIAPAEEKKDIHQEVGTGTGIRDDKELGALESAEEHIEIYQQSGDRLMAVADIALSSKIEGPVALTILGGKYLETKALGQAKRVDNYMRLEMTKWVFPDGRECKINAIALDPKTTYAAVSSRVDHHYLYRYGFWGLGTVLSAIGKAAQLNAKKEVIVSDGVVIETEENDARREVKMAAGELGREIGEVMKKNIDYPSTVYVDVNEQMGFFFIDRVTSKDCK